MLPNQLRWFGSTRAKQKRNIFLFYARCISFKFFGAEAPRLKKKKDSAVPAVN